MNTTIIILLLAGLVASTIICVTLQNLLKSCIALSVVSAILSVIMFLMGAHMAAVFELSVCAGLITVIFVSAISMTKVRSQEEIEEEERTRRKRFKWLPLVLIVLFTGAMFLLWPHLNTLLPYAEFPVSAVEQDVFWNKRPTELLGQIIIVLVGVFGVLIFFKEEGEKE